MSIVPEGAGTACHRHAHCALRLEPLVERVGDPVGESGNVLDMLNHRRHAADGQSTFGRDHRAADEQDLDQARIEVTCHIVEDPVVERAGKALLPA